MNPENYPAMCEALTNATSLCIRLYEGREQLCSNCIFPLEPDPVILYIDELISLPNTAGVLVTDLYQFYGYVSLNNNLRLIAGPSSIPTKEPNQLDSLMALLNVPQASRPEYAHKLCCAPDFSLERMIWAMRFLTTVLTQQPVPPEDFCVSTPVRDIHHHIHREESFQGVPMEDTAAALENMQDIEHEQNIQNAFELEKLMVFYVTHGEVEHLGRLLTSMPRARAGEMARDSLRQLKNMGICSAAVASRAAIEGGLSNQTAFGLSDIYIQKIELLNSPTAIHMLINELFMDFARRVQQTKYGIKNASPLFLKCAQYVSAHLFQHIRIDDMATELNYSRPYLCGQFSRQTGITLTNYILTEKVNEGKYLLQFSELSLSEIALRLSFSSQSHFQSVFKKITGITPMEYRRSVK